MQPIDVKEEKSKEVHTSKMSVERLKTFKGFENVTEDEADEVIKNLEQFALILCKQVQQNVA